MELRKELGVITYNFDKKEQVRCFLIAADKK